jgi:predicted DCC family thiol-disulfide oxidoreductase YuxK
LSLLAKTTGFAYDCRVRKSWQPRIVDGEPDRLILFDGVCVLCSRWARFVMARDPEASFRFVAIQERYGEALALRLGIDTAFAETNAVIVGGRAYFKSDAAIEVLSRLPHWSWMRVCRAAPRFVRDGLYDMVARNRYRLFGRTETCLLPTPELMRHFLGSDARPG